jgi:GTP pyrophosphokinase
VTSPHLQAIDFFLANGLEQLNKPKDVHHPSDSKSRPEADALVAQVKAYDNSKYISYIEKAVDFAYLAHAGQKRASGEAYLYHPISVAEILAGFKMDSLTIIAAILHDTVEDTEVTLEDITREFGSEVAMLVDGVTKLDCVEEKSEIVKQAENLRKFIIAISQDIRILIIKLADRLHNMKTLHHIKSAAKRQKIAMETMELFVPLAERIGMHAIKNELQDLAFTEICFEVRQSIITRLDTLRKSDAALKTMITSSLQALFQQHDFVCEIYGREKSPYSIWDKMRRKNISFEQLSDVIAFRIIVNSTEDCYRALGLIHAKYMSVPGTFEDFISTPKKNGYQSIHTDVIGPSQHKIEVQIRSRHMHEIAEMGVAAHWCYKQRYSESDACKFNKVKGLLEILDLTSDSHELLETTKLEMYEDQIFCFTPKGQIIQLPKGASAVDFAYAVHSSLGNRCAGVKVNSELVPVHTILNSGDQVEILIKEYSEPCAEWEKFVTTGKALSSIRKAVRDHKRFELVNLGKVIVSRIVSQINLELTDDIIGELMAFFQHTDKDDIFSAIGTGEIQQTQLLEYFITTTPHKDAFKDFICLPISKPLYDSSTSIVVGANGPLNQAIADIAHCCRPIPGDEIVGLQQVGKGIAVHLSSCAVVTKSPLGGGNILKLNWNHNIKADNYVVTISIAISGHDANLAPLISEIRRFGTQVVSLKIVNECENHSELLLDVKVPDLIRLSSLMKTLASLQYVRCVYRHVPT